MTGRCRCTARERVESALSVASQARLAKAAADAREAAAKAEAAITDVKRNAKAAAEEATRKQNKAAHEISRLQARLSLSSRVPRRSCMYDARRSGR